MLMTTVPTRRVRMRGLGIALTTAGGRILGSGLNPISAAARPVLTQGGGAGSQLRWPVLYGGFGQNPYTSTVVAAPTGTAGSGTMTSQQLAALMQIYDTNPSALTPQQWSQLQAAGVIPSTLPYSSASLLPAGGSTTTPPASLSTYGDPQCLAIGETGGPYPNCTPATTTAPTDFFSTQYGPLTGLEWVLVAGGAYLLFFKKKGR